MQTKFETRRHLSEEDLFRTWESGLAASEEHLQTKLVVSFALHPDRSHHPMPTPPPPRTGGLIYVHTFPPSKHYIHKYLHVYIHNYKFTQIHMYSLYAHLHIMLVHI